MSCSTTLPSVTRSADDYTVYTFHLRDGLKWSDGQALTAHDFEYGAYCLLNPDMGSPAAYSWFAIKNASAYNSREITDWAEVGVKALDDLHPGDHPGSRASTPLTAPLLCAACTPCARILWSR